jgi:hypothetical protein
MRKAFFILPILLASILLTAVLVSEDYRSNVSDQDRIDLHDPSVVLNLKNMQNRTYPVTVYGASSPTKYKLCKIAVHITGPNKKQKLDRPFTFYVTFTNTGAYPIDSNLDPTLFVAPSDSIDFTKFEVANGTASFNESPWMPTIEKWHIATIEPGHSKTMKVTGIPRTKGHSPIYLFFMYNHNDFYGLEISEVTFNKANKQYQRNNTRSSISLDVETGSEFFPLLLAFLSCGIGFAIAKKR